MEMNVSFGPGNGNQSDGKVWQDFQKDFTPVQNILDYNRLLINEISQNQVSKVPNNLTQNVSMIRELNDNIRRVVDIYARLCTTFVKGIETSSEGDSAGTSSFDRNPGVSSGHKRTRPA